MFALGFAFRFAFEFGFGFKFGFGFGKLFSLHKPPKPLDKKVSGVNGSQALCSMSVRLPLLYQSLDLYSYQYLQ